MFGFEKHYISDKPGTNSEVDSKVGHRLRVGQQEQQQLAQCHQVLLGQLEQLLELQYCQKLQLPSEPEYPIRMVNFDKKCTR